MSQGKYYLWCDGERDCHHHIEIHPAAPVIEQGAPILENCGWVKDDENHYLCPTCQESQ